MKHFAWIPAALTVVLALSFVALKITNHTRVPQTPNSTNSDPNFITR